VYGSPYHPDVVSLRQFRDRCLCRFALGRWLTSLYERVGPHLAKVVEHNSLLRIAARKALSGFVRLLLRSVLRELR